MWYNLQNVLAHILSMLTNPILSIFRVTSFSKLLEYELKKSTYYLIAFALSAVYTLHLFPFDFFVGTNGFWLDTRSDPTQHITGMWAFVNDRWHFPLLYTELLNFPEGVSVAFTDSIPLAAIPFKLIHHWLPEGSHYFGIWVAACYLLQGLTGGYAMTLVSGHQLKGAIFGSLFVLMMPALMIRVPHAALMAQFMLLLSITWYARLSLGQLSNVNFIQRSLVLLLAASLIHPYFIAMLYPIFFASLLSHFFQKRLSALMLVSGLASALVLIFLSFYCVGYISLRNGLPPLDGGFENSSMNLASPFLGTHLASSALIPPLGLTLDATGGQIDGHNYFGLGLWCMLLYLLIGKRQHLATFVKRHWVFIALMFGFFAYSLSSAVYLFDKLILHYTLPDVILPITKIFRGSGRFFWPAGYALLLTSLLVFLAGRKNRYLLLMTALLALQFVDTAQHRAYLTEASSRAPYYGYPAPGWDSLVKEAKTVYMLPAYGCGASHPDALFLQYFTARHGVPFNTGFIARIHSDCVEKDQAPRLHANTGNLFVFLKANYTQAEIEKFFDGNVHNWCRTHPIGTVCLIGSLEAQWEKIDERMFKTMQ